MEKETKIINPHPVESKTTNANTFTGKFGPPASAQRRPDQKQDGPMQLNTDYKLKFPNWKNGKGDFFVERQP